MLDLFLALCEMKVFGAIGMVTSLAIVCIGLPHQAWKLWKEKDAKSLSLPFFLSQKVSVACYFIHGYFEVDNPFIWMPQVLGLLFGMLIVVQIIYYNYFYKPDSNTRALQAVTQAVLT